MNKDEAISTERALELALEALEWINRVNAMEYEYQQKARESLNAIYEALAREAIEQPAQQEPVAWLIDSNYTTVFRDIAEHHRNKGAKVEPLYTSPPTLSLAQRKPLTDDELTYLWYNQSTDWMEFARAIEAAHGIKE